MTIDHYKEFEVQCYENVHQGLGLAKNGLWNIHHVYFLNGRITHGHTMIVDPWGTIVDEAHNPGNGITYAEVDLEKLYKIRAQIPLSKSEYTSHSITSAFIY